MWHWFGASVRGPAHVRDGLPNQDAWLGRHTKGAQLVVISDGLGSRNKSHVGSREACKAAVEAVRIWSKTAEAPVELLLRLIHDVWNVRVHAEGRDDCASTCLVVAAPADGRMIVAQLGDGLVLISKPHAEPMVVTPSRDGFTNQTTGLGIAASLRDWHCHVEPEVTAGTGVLLATDGVSDDLVPDKYAEFIEFIRLEYGSLPARNRGSRLARDLRRWPVPRHADDKTLAFIWKTE